MALCRRCLKNGTRREGGSFGVCPEHRKTKCIICGGRSLGEEFCSIHAHEVQLAHWKARAEVRVISREQELDGLEIRREKLMESKRYFHEAVEVLFQGAVHLLIAVWSPTTRAAEEIEEREAA